MCSPVMMLALCLQGGAYVGRFWAFLPPFPCEADGGHGTSPTPQREPTHRVNAECLARNATSFYRNRDSRAAHAASNSAALHCFAGRLGCGFTRLAHQDECLCSMTSSLGGGGSGPSTPAGLAPSAPSDQTIELKLARVTSRASSNASLVIIPNCRTRRKGSSQQGHSQTTHAENNMQGEITFRASFTHTHTMPRCEAREIGKETDGVRKGKERGAHVDMPED